MLVETVGSTRPAPAPVGGRKTGGTSNILGFQEYRAQPYLTGLDGLRALAILLVLFHHVLPFDRVWLTTLQSNGRYGVSLFFVISGFLICTLLLREEQNKGRVALGKFYGRRALRLMPLYYAVLLLHVVLVLGLHQYSPENELLFREKMPSYLFYYSNWLPTATAGPFFCAWSLAVEEQFYLVFGLAILLAPRRFLVPTLVVALVVKFMTFQFIGNVDEDSTALRIAFSYQEAILWGVLLGFALNVPSIYERVRAVLGRGWMPVALAAGLLGWITVHPMQTQSTWDAEVMYVMMTLLVAAVVIRRTVPGLDLPILVHIGKVSYGIYLLHMIVFSAAKKLPFGDSPTGVFVLTVGGSIVAASLVYWSFERPIIRWYKQRLSPTKMGRPENLPHMPDLGR